MSVALTTGMLAFDREEALRAGVDPCMVASGLVAAPIPGHVVRSVLGEGLTPPIIMALVGAPIYVCSTGSTPLIAALVEEGMSLAAGLALLIAGPATNWWWAGGLGGGPPPSTRPR